MNQYELTFIMDAQLAPEKQEEVITKFLDMLKSRGAEILNVEKWGKKKLAYSIDDRQYGFYLMTQFSAPATQVTEIEHFLKVTTPIFRYLILHRDPKTLKMMRLEAERLTHEAARIAERERAQQGEREETREREPQGESESESQSEGEASENLEIEGTDEEIGPAPKE
ncbi:MAG: 30S ribosomal protein S6 [Candidatus Zixiibacteriota bacterium]|nr:MAG: 30S ribosomal protein S6 [candidate division Zixibacteria bacterium]